MTMIESESEEYVEKEDQHKQEAYITAFQRPLIEQFLYGNMQGDVAAKVERQKAKLAK